MAPFKFFFLIPLLIMSVACTRNVDDSEPTRHDGVSLFNESTSWECQSYEEYQQSSEGPTCGKSNFQDTCCVFKPEGNRFDRHFWVHTPNNTHNTNSLPLLIGFHGFNWSTERFDDFFQLRSFADQSQMVLVLPAGHDLGKRSQLWEMVDCCDTESVSDVTQEDTQLFSEVRQLFDRMDDVDFISQTIDYVTEQYQLDPQQVYLLGSSNGGGLSYRLMCEIPEKLTGVIVAAGLQAQKIEQCDTLTTPVPLMHFHGTADDVMPYEGGVLSLEERGALGIVLLETLGKDDVSPNFQRVLSEHLNFKSMQASVEFWAQKNGCDLNTAPIRTTQTNWFEDETLTTETQEFQSCAAPVIAHAIQGGGHENRPQADPIALQMIEFFQKAALAK